MQMEVMAAYFQKQLTLHMCLSVNLIHKTSSFLILSAWYYQRLCSGRLGKHSPVCTLSVHGHVGQRSGFFRTRMPLFFEGSPRSSSRKMLSILESVNACYYSVKFPATKDVTNFE